MSETNIANPGYLEVANTGRYNAPRRLFDIYSRAHGGIDISGAEHLPTTPRSFMLTPNHDSYWDIPLTGQAIFEALGAYVHFLSKDWFWKLPLVGDKVGGYIESTGGFPVNRGRMIGQTALFEHIDNLANNNAIIGNYAQGTRGNHNPGEVGDEVTTGAAFMAMRHGLLIQPAGLAGTLERNFFAVNFQPAIEVEQVDFNPLDRKQLVELAPAAREITAELVEAMRDGVKEAQRRRREIVDSMPPAFLSKAFIL